MSRITYIPSFDGLRAIAVLFVLLVHGSYGMIKGGWIGVDIFFVLSGYLITSLLREEYSSTRAIDLRIFYIKRLLRLLPALIVSIIICNLLWNYIEKPVESSRVVATLSSLFYTCNLFSLSETGPLGVVWSLSVEEHFYFLWPLTLATFFLIMPSKNQINVLVVSVVLISIFRIFAYNKLEGMHFGLFTINSYMFTFCRLDTLLLGSLLALIPSQRLRHITAIVSNKIMVTIICTAIIMILLTIHVDNIYWRNGGFLITNLLCVSTILFALNNPNSAILSNKITQWMGRRSYGIYLYHTPLFLVLENFREAGNYTNLLIVMILRFAITMIIAEISFRFIEQPILKRYSPRIVQPVTY